MKPAGQRQGIFAALASALFLGVIPIFGKVAIGSGFTPLSLIALRSGIAVILMIVAMGLFKRKFFYIYPVGLLGCLLAGLFNGLGSILYYSALSRLDAGLGQMLYSFYPLFVALWLLLDRQAITRLTAFRLGLALPAMILLMQRQSGAVDLIGGLMMLGSAALYGLHLIINQRILYEAPAPTVTLYTLLSMAVTVDIAYLLFDRSIPAPNVAWWAALSMAFITFSSRVTLFAGVKRLGGLQTALLGLGEVFITVLLSVVFLHERLSSQQWLGALFLAISLSLVGFDRISPQKRISTGWLSWLNPPTIPTGEFPWQSQL